MREQKGAGSHMATADMTLKKDNAAGATDLRDQILPVYAASHHDMMHDPWFHPDRFWERLLDLYAPTRDFELVTGWLGDRVVGYAFGSPHDNAGPLWEDVLRVIPDLRADAVETQPVYLFREFAVDPSHQRHGYGRLIHDALLRDRPEVIANLVVRPDNIPAQAAYAAWNWHKIGTKKPFEDSPVFDSLIKILNLSDDFSSSNPSR